jgi:hypothetical protein
MKKALIIPDPGLFTKIEAVAGFHHRDRTHSFKIDRQLNHRERFRVFCLTVCFFLRSAGIHSRNCLKRTSVSARAQIQKRPI